MLFYYMEKTGGNKNVISYIILFYRSFDRDIIGKNNLRIKTSGTLRIDHSDPQDGPYLFLELEKGMYDISKRHYILLEVKLKNYYSHK